MKRLSYKTAMLLHLAGIDVPTKGYYLPDGRLWESRKPNPNYLCKAPRIAEAIEFLSEQGIIASPFYDGADFCYRTFKDGFCIGMDLFCKDMVDASEKAIIDGFKALKNEKV